MYKGVYNPKVLLILPAVILLGGTVFILITGPMLIRRAYRKKGVTPPPDAKLVKGCFWTACTMFLGLPMFLFLSFFVLDGINIVIKPFVGESTSFIICMILLAIFLLWTLKKFLFHSSEVCIPPVEDPTLPHPLGKQRVLLVGILALTFWVGFCVACVPSSLRAYYLSNMPRYNTYLKKINKGLCLYHSEYKYWPDHLGRLVERKYMTYVPFKLPHNSESFLAAQERYIYGETFEAPPDWNYIKLPKDAPGNLLWVWPDPEAYDGERFLVLCADGSVKMLTPEKFPAALKETNDWLAEHKQNK